MTSRMDKHRSNSEQSSQSRSKKNEHLYQELYTNKILTEFTNVKLDNVIDLTDISAADKSSKREEYQKTRILNQDEKIPRRHENDFLLTVGSVDIENRNYNINDILEEAKKNRKEDDELEKQRRLKKVEYSILSDISKEKIKEYNEYKKKISKEEENLEELIHTITSNSLRQKIDDELLSDLLPTEESETIISGQLLEEIEKSNQEMANSNIEKDVEQDSAIDKSFYTKSMDLSKEDFEFDDDDKSFLEEKKMGIIPKILLTLLVIAVLAVVGYVVYRYI